MAHQNINPKERKMKKISICLIPFLLLFSACSSNPDESTTRDSQITLDENLILLDSISQCLSDTNEISEHSKIDTVRLTQRNNTLSLVFPSEIYCSRENIKSIGVSIQDDTISVELIQKESKTNAKLDCPVWVYSTLNRDLKGKYLQTRTNVYALIKQ